MGQDVEDAIVATLREAVGGEAGALMTPARAETAALMVGGLVALQLGVSADAIRATLLGDPARGEFGVRVEPHAMGMAGRLRRRGQDHRRGSRRDHLRLRAARLRARTRVYPGAVTIGGAWVTSATCASTMACTASN